MNHRNRRDFLADVGRGMLIAGLGSGLAGDLGVGKAWAETGPDSLDFGGFEPLVDLMQQTPTDKILAVLVEKLNSGAPLRQLTAAAALANAQSFGGEDYIGFHTMMALVPSYLMAQETPGAAGPLPVLKVLYRNTKRIHDAGAEEAEILKRIAPADVSAGEATGDRLRDTVRQLDLEGAERLFAAIAQQGPDYAFNELLHMVDDEQEVHRVVLPYRAYSLIDLVGPEHAHTLLRQSVRYCIRSESRPNVAAHLSESRELLPKLLDQYRLLDRSAGSREADDAWIDSMTRTLFESTPAQAADAVAAALAEGFTASAIGEAISLAANQLVLRDAGRPANQAQPNKPVGSIHGDSIGVHASDSANAWRNMALVGNDRNRAACLILAGYQVARDRVQRSGDFLAWTPWPNEEMLAGVAETEAAALLAEAETAIRGNDQARACAVVHKYGALGHEPRSMFDLMLRYSTSEDGALHAEKYYRTVCDEYASTRPALRWRQVVALSRVVASSCNQPAEGVAEARQLLGV